jgi:hypothetical protein
MSETSITLFGGGGLWLLLQVALLVLYYGNIYPDLPWFVVWFPCLIAGGIIVLCILIGIIILLLSCLG